MTGYQSKRAAAQDKLAHPEQDGQCKRCTDGCPACDARKLPKQEPVAHRDGYWCADLTCSKCYGADFRLKHTPPPQRKPLTDDELFKICMAVPKIFDFARAIEAAHGIKENT